MTEELEEIRKKKLEELKRQYEQQEKIKALLKRCLEPEAYERMMNVMVANDELFSKAAEYVLAFCQRYGKKISDRELKMLLSRLTGEKKETKIKILRK